MSQPATILVVDDNPVVLFSMVHLLESAGFRIRQAPTAKAALHLAHTEPPDLVLLDVMLPDSHGFDLCRQLKSDPATRHSFVVLLSDKETSSERQATGLDAGADGYISRPIENRELLARVQAMMRIQQAEAALREARDELEQRVIERTAELSRANDHLRELSQRLVDVQEAERRAIASELHDEIGQWLTGLKLFLETSLQPNVPVTKARLAESTALVDEAMTRVRQLSLNLRPQVLDDLGLVPALEWHFKRFGQQTGILVEFRHTAVPRHLPARVQTAAFRIAQEAITNVARHAGVKQAAVRLWTDAERLGLEIEDHGVGFDATQALAARATSGLAGIRERTELLGGAMNLEAKRGEGTRLTIELPLPKDAAPATGAEGRTP